jgi:hypothetical protein
MENHTITLMVNIVAMQRIPSEFKDVIKEAVLGKS